MNWLDIFGSIDRDRNRATPMYARIYDIIRRGIESGQLAGNVKLPTERELSTLLELDRSTVSRAYLELEKAGLVDSHVGRGTFVREGTRHAGNGRPDRTEYPAMPWSEIYSRFSQTAFGMLSRQWAAQAVDAGVISFAGGIPTQEFFPQNEFREIVSYLNSPQLCADMFAYSPAEGHADLRAQLRKHLSEDGLIVDDDQLLIVSGSQ